MKPLIYLKVYTDSAPYDVAWKQADLEVEIAGGTVRFYCTVELDERCDILPNSLRIADFGNSEFLYDGSVGQDTVLLPEAHPCVSDNIYPVSLLRPEVFSHALANAAAAVIGQLYDTEYV